MKPAAACSVFWAGLEAAVSGGLSFAGAFVVARLIGPSEFGIGAAAVAVHVLLWVAVNALFADALVQCSALDDEAAASAFWASTLVGALGAVVQAAAGWLLAPALADTRLIAMGLVLALPLPLVGAGGVVQGVLTRKRAYRALAGRAVIGQGLGTAAGIAAALAGAGAWAPVLQQAVGSAAGALTLLLRARWRPVASELEQDFVLEESGQTMHFFSELYLRELLQEWSDLHVDLIEITHRETGEKFKQVWRGIARR